MGYLTSPCKNSFQPIDIASSNFFVIFGFIYIVARGSAAFGIWLLLAIAFFTIVVSTNSSEPK